ncbi:MAG: IPExxxVDY family protein [Bacteroidales bacterium]
MAKKIKIDIDFSQDNFLVAISCHQKDYWIAYRLNEALKLNLKRMNDLPVFQSKMEKLVEYPLFSYEDPDTNVGYYLISNHNPESKLFPAQRTTDYLLLANGTVGASEKKVLLERIKKIPKVLTAYELELSRMKNIDSFLSDLELFMLD